MKSWIGAAVAGILALSMAALAVYLWLSLGTIDTAPGDYVGLVFGGLGTLGLGVGLMALALYSHRKGFDDRAGSSPAPDRHDPP